MLHKVNIIKKENDEIEMSLNATDKGTAEKLAKSINITLDHDKLRTEIVPAELTFDAEAWIGKVKSEIVPAELTLDDKEAVYHGENCFCSICVDEVVEAVKAREIAVKLEEKPKHYQRYYTRDLTDAEIESGMISINMDPYRIADIYDISGGPREQIVKKGLRWTSKGQSERQVIKEIIQACERRIQMLDEDGVE